MTISTLNLPVDIPWKRIAISPDMYFTSGALPPKWRSSLAIFSYDPPPDPELSNPDELTTFLKVVATVTGYQPSGVEIDTRVLGSRRSAGVLKNFDQLTDEYYPALAAILQVWVTPNGGNWTVDQYPYLTDFEPKKREIVELVTDTGEALTQSGSNVNVRKGTTSTDSTEQVDIDRGGSFGVNVTTPYGGGGVTSSQQKEVGTRSDLGTQGVNITTSDASREKRESYSHTTSLAQLYQLLDSYHAGTNRAVFFVNARPHIVDSDYTFVKGPRRLEGIQEFFLVVRRPKDMEEICVDARLETAHLHEVTNTQTTGETVYDQTQISNTYQLEDGANIWGTVTDGTSGAWTLTIPAGYHLDASRGGGPRTITWANGDHQDIVVPAGVDFSLTALETDEGHELEAIPHFDTFSDHVDIKSKVYASEFDARETLVVTVYTISDQPIETPQTTTTHEVDLFITAREVTSCTRRFFPWPVYVPYETRATSAIKQALAAAREGGRTGAVAANALNRAMHDEMIKSYRADVRYPPGEVSFYDSQFALRALTQDIDPAALPDTPVHTLDGVPESIRQRLSEQASALTVADALTASAPALAQRGGISLVEARRLQASALGLHELGDAAESARAITTPRSEGAPSATVQGVSVERPTSA